MFPILVLSSGAGLIVACGEEEEGSGDKVVDFLRGCGLLSEGEVDTSGFAGGDCEINCLTGQTCDEARAGFCMGMPAATYLTCIQGCAQPAPSAAPSATTAPSAAAVPMVACADGTMVPGMRCNLNDECPDSSDETGCAELCPSPSAAPTAAPSGT